jgi:hypothetical protein
MYWQYLLGRELRDAELERTRWTVEFRSIERLNDCKGLFSVICNPTKIQVGHFQNSSLKDTYLLDPIVWLPIVRSGFFGQSTQCVSYTPHKLNPIDVLHRFMSFSMIFPFLKSNWTCVRLPGMIYCSK